VSSDENGTFISRWSRRKIAVRRAEAAEPVTPAPAPSPAATAGAVAGEPHGEQAAPALPDVESLQGLESEYRDFLRPEVDESLRRTALKKLFADPHFNVMDGLDIYIDDYSKPDPIEPAMLRALNQARGLRLFDDEEKPAEPDAVAAAAQQEQLPAAAADLAATRTEVPSQPTDCPVETKSTDAALHDGPSVRNPG
jgi:hypothetical protein